MAIAVVTRQPVLRPRYTAVASSSVQFAMDVREAAGPTYGWTSKGSGQEAGHTVTFEAGGGPGGRNAVHIDLIGFADHVAAGLNGASGNRFGWSGAPGYTKPAQGGARYYRYYIKLSVIVGVDSSASSGGPWGGKHLIVNSSENNQRAIGDLHVPSDTQGIRWQQGVEGAPHMAGNVAFVSTGWHAWQHGLFVSTTTSSADGGYRTWRNTDVEGSPSSVSGFATSMDMSTMSDAGIELFNAMHPLGASETLRVSFAAFEAGTAFDSAWYANMGA